MARLTSAVIAIMLAAALPAHAEIMNKDLSQWCTSKDKATGLNDSWCRGYIAGISDVLAATDQICPGDKPFKEQVAVVGKVMRATPEYAEKPASVSVTVILMAAYPCKDKGAADELVKSKPRYGW